MYLFSITINIEDSHQKEWLSWVKAALNKLLTDKALVQDFRLLKILSEEPNSGSSFSFQYHLSNLADVELFEDRYDREVAVGMYRLYDEKFVEFRTRLEVIDWKL
jgi:hypothetical protein